MATGNGRSPARRALRAVYLVLCNTLLLCVLLEVGWRALGLAGRVRPEGERTSQLDVHYTLHPYFQTVFPPYPMISRGPFLAGWPIDPAAEALAPGRFRLMFLGGSTTACDYPHFVRAQVEVAAGPTTAYVLGYDWHCSLHSLYKVWTYGDEVRPDLAIVLENVNDFYRGFTAPDTSLSEYRSDYSHSSGGLHPFWLKGRSRFDDREVFYSRPSGRFDFHEARDESLHGLLRSIAAGSAVLRSLGVRPPEPSVPVPTGAPSPEDTVYRSLPDFERNLRNLALSCKAKGIPVLFLTMPFTTRSARSFLPPGSFFTNDGISHLSPEGFERGMERFNAVVESLRDEPHAFVLPLAREIRDPALFVDEVHLTREGQELEAGLVARFIQERGILKEPRNR